MEPKQIAAELNSNADDKPLAMNRFVEIKTSRCNVRDSIVAVSYRIDFVDASGNHWDMSAYKSKSTNETTYTLYTVKDDEMREYLVEKVIALLQNDFQTRVSTLFYSEDVLYQAPWKVEHSFCIDGHKFTLVILLEENCFFLKAVSNSATEAFSDRLAAYLRIVMMESLKNSKE